VRFHEWENSILEYQKTFNAYKKAVGNAVRLAQRTYAGGKWKEREKSQAKAFCITHGLLI